MTNPLVSVIIPVYQDWDRLQLCVNALAAQSLPAASIEIIIANNESEPRSEPADFPLNARMIHAPKPGSYAARNAAVAAAKGRVLAFTDSDCIPYPDWLQNGSTLIEQHPQARVTGPVHIFAEEGTGRWAYLYDFHTAFRQKENAARGSCVTANLLVGREVFQSVGNFNEQLLSGGDTEWNQRATAAGIAILFEEGVAVGHPARRSLSQVFRKRRRIAGAKPETPGLRLLPYILRRIKPPIREVLNLDRAHIGIFDRCALFMIMWALRWVSIWEVLLVLFAFKKPNRA